MEFMAIRVRPTPTRFPINILYILLDKTSLHSISIVRRSWGMLLLFRRKVKILIAHEERMVTPLYG